MKEFETLRGDNSYGRFIRDKDLELNKYCRIQLLRGILKVASLNKAEAFKIIEACGLKYKTLEEVDRALKQREFDIEVEKLKNQNKPETKITFEELYAPIVIYFKIPFEKDITVAQYCAIEKLYKESINTERKRAK